MDEDEDEEEEEEEEEEEDVGKKGRESALLIWLTEVNELSPEGSFFIGVPPTQWSACEGKG